MKVNSSQENDNKYVKIDLFSQLFICKNMKEIFEQRER